MGVATSSGIYAGEAPYIMKADYRVIRSSDADRVMQIKREFDDCLLTHDNDIAFGYECWDAYFALNGGQWNKEKLRVLQEQKRHPYTFDILGAKTATLAGSLVSELPDTDWVPVEGQKTTGTEAVRESWDNDKRLLDLESVLAKLVRDGLVHIGWIQMVESWMYGKPVIGFERILPGYLIPGRYWMSDNDRHQKDCYKRGYFDPEGIAFKYKAKSDEINRAIREIKKSGQEKVESNSAELRKHHVGKVGGQYQVIEYHWLEMVHTTRLVGVGISPDGKAKYIPFPVTDDRAKLESYAQANNIAWETVDEAPYDDMIHHTTTICPDLDPTILIEDGKSKIQVRGLPFFHFTVDRHEGKNKGIVASMLDPQRTINEREALVTELISKANGGSTLIDSGIFKDPKQQESFRQRANKPGHMEFVDLAQMKGNTPIIPVPANQYPSQVLDQIGRMYDQVFPVVGRVSDSMSAISTSGKSGILFEKEYQVNRIGNLLLDKNIKQLMRNIGDAYFYQWQISYAGYERELAKSDGKGSIVLNERILANGKVAIRNAVEYTPRCRVVVSDSTNSPTYQLRYRSMYSELLQNINPEIMPEHYMYVFSEFIKTLDINDRTKSGFEKVNSMALTRMQMRYVAEVMRYHADAKNSAVTAAQADQMLQQIMSALQQGNQAEQQANPPVPEMIVGEDEMIQEPGQDAPIQDASTVEETGNAVSERGI